MSPITIGFIPNERFSKAAEALDLLFENTRIPFHLIIVDGATPQKYKDAVDRIVHGRSNVTRISTNHYLVANQASNLVVKACETEFLAFVENDVLVRPDWLDLLYKACEEHPAEVAVPTVVEHRGRITSFHFDRRLGWIQPVPGPGAQLKIVRREFPADWRTQTERLPMEMIEKHCYLIRRSTLNRVGPFDEELTTREPLDFSLALYRANARIVLEPRSCVDFFPPPPLEPEERDFFLMKRDYDWSARNHERIVQRWNLVDIPSSMEFVKRRNKMAEEESSRWQSVNSTRQEICDLVPPGESFVLVDEQKWSPEYIAPRRRAFPIMEREGRYWGRPADGAVAVRELERLRDQGARAVVIGAPAFWWLEYYKELTSYLRASFPCVLENERLVAFDLRPSGNGSAS